MTTLIRIHEPGHRTQAAPPAGFALWQLGFRPFYLLASAFAALSIPLWALQYAGWLGRPYLHGPLWHAHEMVFGFTLAVIVGFLLTAGRNWSGRSTPTGAALAGLALLWLAARVLVLTPFGWLAATANVAFPVAAAMALAVPFIAGGSRRNYFFVGLLLLLAAAAAWRASGAAGRAADAGPWAGIQLALDVVLFIVSVMAGRVLPMFTNNGVRGAAARRHPLVERRPLGGVLVLLLADACRPRPCLPAARCGGRRGACAALAAVAAVEDAARPHVWVLHAAYLWVPVHLALRALAVAGVGCAVVRNARADHRRHRRHGHRHDDAHRARAHRTAAARRRCRCRLLRAGAARRAGARRYAMAGTGVDPGVGAAVGGAVVGRLRVVRRALLAGADPPKARRQARLMDYAELKRVHQTPVLLSVCGFGLRGLASFAGAAWVGRRLARTLPHLVDTILLASAVALAGMLRLNPLTTPWLAAKIVGLVLYIALGMLALRPGRPVALRLGAWAAALLTFGWIASVAMTKHPLGALQWLAGAT